MRVGTFTVSAFLDPMPIEIPEPYQLLTRPGMAGTSCLFFPPQFPAIPIRTLATASSESSALNLANRYVAMRRKLVEIDDGQNNYPGTLIIRATPVVAPAGLVVGGNAAGDSWEVLCTWLLLIDGDQFT